MNQRREEMQRKLEKELKAKKRLINYQNAN